MAVRSRPVTLDQLGPAARKQAAAQLGRGAGRGRPRKRQFEQALQKEIVSRILMPLEEVGELTFTAIPNGFKRTKAEAGIAKAMGQRAGAWDLMILVKCARCFGVEVKYGEGAPSDSQDTFAERAGRFGARTYVCWNFADVIHALESEGVSIPPHIRSLANV
jgi:hypothetical protein